VGACSFTAELVMPSSTYLGLRKEGSYLYGTWRDTDGNLLRALRGVAAESSTMRFLFTSAPGRHLERHAEADHALWSGVVTTTQHGDGVTVESTDEGSDSAFVFSHQPEGCGWRELGYLDVTGSVLGPGMQWFNTWDGGACFSATAKYRSKGTFLGRTVEGFVGHEIHYFTPGSDWMASPYAAGREICWQQVANEYDDGSIVQATFACGADGWGFAMVEDGTFQCSTDVDVEARVRANGYPEQITYRFLDQSWTWRIDPQGERAMIAPGPMRGADGTCTRDGDDRLVRHSMGNSDWWVDGRADPIIAK
jgi:hypothetical protein